MTTSFLVEATRKKRLKPRKCKKREAVVTAPRLEVKKSSCALLEKRNSSCLGKVLADNTDHVSSASQSSTVHGELVRLVRA